MLVKLLIPIVFLLACAHKDCPRQVILEKPVYTEIRVKAPCLAKHPDELSLQPVPPPANCKEGFVCYTAEQALRLADNIEKLLQRVQDDWTLCGERKEKP